MPSYRYILRHALVYTKICAGKIFNKTTFGVLATLAERETIIFPCISGPPRGLRSGHKQYTITSCRLQQWVGACRDGGCQFRPWRNYDNFAIFCKEHDSRPQKMT